MEYVGLVLLVAVLIAGVVKASHSFSDMGIAEAVVKKLKAAIEGWRRGASPAGPAFGLRLCSAFGLGAAPFAAVAPFRAAPPRPPLAGAGGVGRRRHRRNGWAG